MLPKNATYLDINLNSSVITQRISAKLLTSTIECLIYMKNQIPFPFETFQQMTDKLKKCRSDDKQSWNNFLLDKQRLLAVETFDKVNSLLKVCLLILCGCGSVRSVTVHNGHNVIQIFPQRTSSASLKPATTLTRPSFCSVPHA